MRETKTKTRLSVLSRTEVGKKKKSTKQMDKFRQRPRLVSLESYIY